MSQICHSIISWDASFRNFFHLLPSLLEQDYDLSTVEFIFVEQRDRQTAQAVADAFKVRSFADLSRDPHAPLNIETLFLDERDDSPYHPGRALNAGIARARGEIISAMDADILVPRNFLSVLDRMHAVDPLVATMFRYMADRPCGVPVSRWTEQIIDYELVMNICPRARGALPAEARNKAPLLSARREYWEKLGSYDPHPVFATSYTLFGLDVSARFKILLGDEAERALPVACVHPWHPTEVNREQDEYQLLYELQSKLIGWSIAHNIASSEARQEIADAVVAPRRKQLRRLQNAAEEQMRSFTRRPGG